MPIFGWATTTTGTAAATAVPIWNSPTMGTGTICLSSASLYQAMANQTVSQTGTALSNAYYNSTTGEIWVEHTQYLALAQNRATVYHARTETERLCAEQAQQAARAHQEQWMEKQRIALARSRELEPRTMPATSMS